MVKRTRRNGGYSLTEMMLVVAILGILSTVGPLLITQTNKFFLMTTTKADLQKEARAAMYVINRALRQAQSNSITIDRLAAGQPFYSRITFTKIQGTTMSFHQNGNQLIMTQGTNIKILTKNVRYLAFNFPRSEDLTIVSIGMTLEKATYGGQTKALHMASEKVRVMN